MYSSRDLLFKLSKKNVLEIPSFKSISLQTVVTERDAVFSHLSFLLLILDQNPYIYRIKSSVDKKKVGNIVSIVSNLPKKRINTFFSDLFLQKKLLLNSENLPDKELMQYTFFLNSNVFEEYNLFYEKFSHITSLKLHFCFTKMSKAELILLLSTFLP